eukprot:CAMPEP_0172592394 /NCGR_PEP_ID=MMETSP1068-20121228/11357_1 /TAXON_ID=35684 /ORGANISM="Pseudopedinella elastica, Strain CCMP716" /LENGTH=33 /DNA_ID= /DNA_START= /DNA_END= /DNA_ORIENTATION=
MDNTTIVAIVVVRELALEEGPVREARVQVPRHD